MSMETEPFRVVISVFNEGNGWTLPNAYVEQIRAVSERVTTTIATTRAEVVEQLPKADGLIGFPLTDDEFATHGRNLKWIQLTSAIDDLVLDMPTLMGSPVRITTAEGLQATQRSEHAILLILAILRKLNQMCAAQLDHRWASSELSGDIDDLEGKTVGIIGMGSLGHAIARRLQPFNVELLVTLGESAAKGFDGGQYIPPDRIDELLGRSDIVVLSVPASVQHHHLLNRSLLSNLSAGSILINVSHGELYDEETLIEMLNNREIGAAALDAFRTTPLAETSPLWRMPNVIITPRMGGISKRYWERATKAICDNLARVLDGRPLLDELGHHSG